MNFNDNYRHKGMRKQLVEEIRAKGIEDERVLQALEAVPRHCFLDPAFLQYAYQDKAFQIGEGQTISQPYTVAYQTSMLRLQKGMKVLEIGTGSGYQASVLAEMGVKVFSIERQRPLHDRSKALLEQLGYRRVKCFFGDGFEGLPAFAPFDRVLITAAIDHVPEKLAQQLAVGGLMVLPIGEQGSQTMTLVRKSADGLEQFQGADFSFVPMLKGKVY